MRIGAPLAGGLALLATLAAEPSLAARRPAAPDEALVHAAPHARRVAVGDLVTVAVRIRGARRVGSVPFTLTYDPAILEYVASGAKEGDFLSSGGGATSFLARAGRAPGGGSGVVVGLSRLGGAGNRGRGLLCTLTFRARSPGIARVGFTRAEVLSPAARPLPSRFTGASVRVGAAR